MAARTLSHYEILETLGEGGMGVVYKARDTRLDRHVAIKVIRAQYAANPMARERFRREALAAAAVDHPFLCKVFEIGEQDGELFIVMEYIAGETLHARLRKGKVDGPDAVRIGIEIAEAIEQAHAQNFVHRDLKPANVMLTGSGRVKVMDFGLAKRLTEPVAAATTDAGGATATLLQASLTTDGSAVGTPDYMSPEQVRGEAVDRRSDLFSFGILLCELLHGVHPFRKSKAVDTVSSILRDPPSISVVEGVNIPTGLTVVVRKLLAKDPEDRYPSMKEVREDLARLSAPSAESVPAVAPGGTPLIGRETERAELRRLLDAALTGRGAVVMIGGEPGIGKTHLTEALLRDAAARGCFTCVGHCYEMEGAPPYVPFIEMLEYSARTAPRDGFRRALGDAAGEIARLMPELRRIYSDIPAEVSLPPEMQRRYLFNAYRDFMERSCRVTPIVAIYEDLHWADEPTLQLLHHLAQTAAAQPMLLVGTYRDVELDVGRPFAKTLESMLRQKLATRISLRRLEVRGVEAMIAALSGQQPPPSLARVVFEETEGNPFFVEEVFRHLAEEGKLFDDQGAWLANLRVEQLQVPEGVRLVLGRRLERLSLEARRILTTAAVIGRSFSLGLLEKLESANPDAALEAVESAERAHLVTADAGGRDPRYRFVHELVRQTLADGLSLPRRQRLHARIADAVEQLYGAALDKHIPALAHHLYQAGAAIEPDRAVRYLLLAAGRAAASAANEEALENLDRALGLMEEERSLRAAHARECRAAALRSLQRQDEAIADYEAAALLYVEQGDRNRAASLGSEVASVQAWRMEHSDADATVARSLALNPPDPVIRRRLLAVQSVAASSYGDCDRGLALLEEADSIEVDGADARVRTCRAHLSFHVGRFARAWEEGLAGIAEARAIGDLWIEADLAWVPPWAEFITGRASEGALTRAAEWSERAERAGHLNSAVICRLAGAAFATMAGCLDRLKDDQREVMAMNRRFRNRWIFLEQTIFGVLLTLRGDLDEALALLEQAAEAPDQGIVRGWAASAQFAAQAAAGHPLGPDRAAQIRAQFGSGTGYVPNGTRYGTLLLIQGLGMLDRPAQAAGYAQAAASMVDGAPFALICGDSGSVAGYAAACAGSLDAARRLHHDALTRAENPLYRTSAPIARFWLAESLRIAGDCTAARPHFEQALRLAEEFGLPVYARLARERM